MNFTRFLSLFLVLCLLIGASPIQAEAAGFSAAVAAFLASDAAPIIGSILVALGVTAVASSTHVFDTVVSDCVEWLSQTTSYIVDGGVWLAEYTYNGVKQLFAPEGLIQSVRDFLFTSSVLQTVTALSGATISCTGVKSSGGMRSSVNSLIGSSPENTLYAFQNLGVNKDVFILSVSDAVMTGCFFDSSGIFTIGSFVNPLGVANGSLFGTYSLSELELYGDGSFTQPGTYQTSSTGGTYQYPYLIFYSPEYAASYSDFLTINCYAFDWSKLPSRSKDIYANYHPAFYLFSKGSSSTVMGSSSYNMNLISFPTSGTSLSGLSWDTTTYESITTDFDLKLENVALSGASLAAGYAYWSSGAIAIPGSVSIPNQKDEDEKYLPIVRPGTMQDVYDMTQDEAQTNTVTGNPATDAVTFTSLKELLESIRDYFSNWFARISLNVSNILDAVRNGFNALISAVANIPKLITALLRFLVEQLRGLGFIWELLQMIGNYLGSIFSWMPESMHAIVMVTFAIAGLYMLIGR